MKALNVQQIDLNLLRVFRAIYTARQLTRAGDGLGMTQPAMSHALRRLRGVFHDELFVRSANGMAPTARASEIITAVSEALDRLQAALAPTQRFDPATARHVLHIGINDYGAAIVVPLLIGRLRREAPHVDVRTTHIGTTAAGDRGFHELGYELLDAGAIELAIMHRHDHPPRFSEELLFAEPAVCVVARRNRLVGRKLDLATYLKLGHVRVYFEVDEETWVDRALATMRKSRRVVVTLPHFAAAFATVANSDLIATVPSSMARSFSRIRGLRFLPPPLERTPSNEIVQVWHRRHDRDAAHLWMRAVIRDSCRAAQKRSVAVEAPTG